MNLLIIEIINFRNLQVTSLALHPEINILVGGNGQGKSNFMEAVSYLGTGRSWRGARDADIARWGATFWRIEGRTNEHHLALAYQVDSRRKLIWIDGIVQPGRQALFGHLPAVLFTPEDLQLVKAAPEYRRYFIDQLLSQVQPGYTARWLAYQRVLRQRNRLLAARSSSRELAPWDAQLVTSGSWLIEARLGVLCRLAGSVRYYYGVLAGVPEDALAITYASSVFPLDLLSGFPPAGQTEVEAAFWSALGAQKKREMARGITMVGPHRDDLGLLLEGHPARFFASQGQQRLLAVALRLAAQQLLADTYYQQPLVLLDDIFSELDPQHCHQVATAIGRQGQAIITAPDLSYLPGEIREAAGLTLHVDKGCIKG